MRSDVPPVIADAFFHRCRYFAGLTRETARCPVCLKLWPEDREVAAHPMTRKSLTDLKEEMRSVARGERHARDRIETMEIEIKPAGQRLNVSKGPYAGGGDGLPLFNVAHPRKPWWRRACRRVYRTFWPRYCGCVCRSRFLYNGACSDHNTVLSKGYGFEYGYDNIYTDLWYQWHKFKRWVKRDEQI